MINLLELLGKFASRKFLISAGATAGAMVLANLLRPEILDKVSPYIWAGIAIAGLYVVVEGVPDAVERIIRAVADLTRARAAKEIADKVKPEDVNKADVRAEITKFIMEEYNRHLRK